MIPVAMDTLSTRTAFNQVGYRGDMTVGVHAGEHKTLERKNENERS